MEIKGGVLLYTLAVLVIATPATHAANPTGVVLDYADSRTFIDYPLMVPSEVAVADGEGALVKAHVEGETLDKQHQRFDAEAIANMHDEMGSAYSAMGAHVLALMEYGKARAITNVSGKYDSDAAAEMDGLGRYDDADKLYQEMLKKRPDDLFGRGKYGFYLLERGRYTESRDALLSLLKEPDLDANVRSYALVSLYLAVKGAGGDSRAALQPYLGSIDHDTWPAPLISFFAGQKTEAELLHALQQEGDPQSNLCEALFYMGRDVELGGDKQKALDYYRQVLRTNYVGYSEYVATVERLKALQPSHPGEEKGKK